MRRPSEVLDAAADRIAKHGLAGKAELKTKETEDGSAYAVDANGCGVYPNDPAAVKWCMIGAVGAELGMEHMQPIEGGTEHLEGIYLRAALPKEYRAKHAPGTFWPYEFSDSHTAEEVIEVLRKAAELARSEGN
jgi:hypothetical protein